MVKNADRIVIRDGGYLCRSDPYWEPSLCEITNKTDILEFNKLFRFSSKTQQCMFFAYPGIDWWRDGKPIVISAFYHGTALDIEGMNCYWRFSRSSGRRIQEWLRVHCGEYSIKRTSPMHFECAGNRYDLEEFARKWIETHEGRHPDITNLRTGFEEAMGLASLSCPAGGEYSLSFDEKGVPHVSCSIPHHD